MPGSELVGAIEAPEERRRLRLRSARGRQGAIRAAEAVVGALLFLLLIQSLLGFSFTDGLFWARFSLSLWDGFAGTLYYVAIVLPLSLGIGFFAGWARVSSHPALAWPVSVYVDLIRGIPPFVLVLFAFNFGPNLLPERFNTQEVGLLFSAFAVAMHSGAYQAEIFRAGFQSVPRGQVDAAVSLGLSPWRTMAYIILPQAFRLSLPPLSNEFSVLVKDTSLLGALGAVELFAIGAEFRQKIIISGIGPLSWLFATWAIVAALYFVINFVLTRGVLLVEKRYRVPGMVAAT